MKLRFSIRLQLLVLSLFLFAIPWLGYKYVWELEQYLRIGQEQTMIGTARAVATALHERPALFDSSRHIYKTCARVPIYTHRPLMSPFSSMAAYRSGRRYRRSFSLITKITWLPGLPNRMCRLPCR